MIDDGGPAFPMPGTRIKGMSLLDHFAGTADISWEIAENHACTKDKTIDPTTSSVLRSRAKLRYDEAEAMIREKRKRNTNHENRESDAGRVEGDNPDV